MKGDNMNSTPSFIKFLNANGGYCYSSIVEEFLLSIKINNIIFLSGKSHIDKSTFLQYFIEYFNQENEFNKRIISNFKVGKTFTSQGFAVKRKDILNILPKISYEDKCDFIVDGIKVNAHLNLTPRLFFKLSDNKEFHDYLANATENNIEKLDYEIILNESDKYNFKIFNANHLDKDYDEIIDYIKEAKDNISSHYFIIFNHVDDDNINSVLFDEDLPSNLTIFYNAYLKDCSSIADAMAVVQFDPVSPMDYLQNNLSNINFKNISYLENPQREYLGNINDIKKTLQGIQVSENKSLYNILIDELNRLYHILAGDDIYISTSNVDNILKYMIVSWRYEDCPDIFSNWYKYFDFQVIQRVIPLLAGEVSIETFEALIDFCSGEFNYYRSYSRISGML